MIRSISGARGLVGVDFNEQACFQLSRSFGLVILGGAIAVGRDTRPSGRMAMAAVTAGLLETSHQVIDLGIVPTPTVEFAIPEISASGGIIITASHNPAEWNGLKFLDKDGLFLSPEVIKKVYSASLSLPVAGKIPPAEKKEEREILSRYLKSILNLVDTSLVRRRGFKVVVDCINGATYQAAPELLSQLGCQFILLNGEPSGIFSHPPEPRPEHLVTLCEKVKETGADIGLAFDPDGDRLALVSEKGEPLSEELTLAFCVDHILFRNPGPVVVNLSTSMVVEEICQRYGVPLYRTPVGEFYVVQKMSEVSSPIGGEGNGGVIYPAGHPGRDGLIATALILEYLAQRQEKVSEVAAKFPEYHLIKEKVPVPNYPKEEVEKRAKSVFPGAKIDCEDGVRLSGKGWWSQIRFSNTEPVIRIFSEARTKEEAKDRLVRLKETLLFDKGKMM